MQQLKTKQINKTTHPYPHGAYITVGAVGAGGNTECKLRKT